MQQFPSFAVNAKHLDAGIQRQNIPLDSMDLQGNRDLHHKPILTTCNSFTHPA